MLDRALAVLCLFLLLFSVGHAAVGHSDALLPAHTSNGPQMSSLAQDTADTCALCVAISTAVVLAIFAFGLPEVARPRPQTVTVFSQYLPGWDTSLFSRPPPTL